MSNVNMNAKGEGMQATCQKCGSAMKTGWSNTMPRRMVLVDCEKCAADATAGTVICPKCGGGGRVYPDPTTGT
jgi:hypothetical protein